MKTIYFAGFKGGVGKTTLSVNFCKYLHFYENKKVVLLDTDTIDILEILSHTTENTFPIVSKRGVIDAPYLDGFHDIDYLIVDCASNFSHENLNNLQYADKFIVPFHYSTLDYFKLESFVKVVRELGKPLEDILLLPNQYTDRLLLNNTAKNLLHKNKTIQKVKMLPVVPRSSHFMELEFGKPEPSLFYHIRPAFNEIIKNIV